MSTARSISRVFALTLLAATPVGALAQSFGTALTGAAEFPAGSGSPVGDGLAAITVKGTTITFSILVKGISTPTLAHIHRAPFGASGGVVFDFHAPVFTNGFASGSTTGTPADVADLLANPSNYYVNVHTAEFPVGALRGQLGPARQPTASFVTTLSGAGEAPAAGAPDAGGVAQVTISGTTVAYTLVVQGLVSPPTAAHIHRGLAGASGPVVVPFTAPASGVVSGTTTITAALASEILSNPSGFYVNVHNADFPGGAVRGVLNPSSPATTYFPTVVKAAGLNGTAFVSDLRIANTTATAANVVVDYFASAASATGPAATKTVTVTSGAQAVYNDVLGSLFGASGLGSLRITSDLPVIVASRVLNDQRPVDGGTNGLLVPGSVLADAPINGVLPLLSNGSPSQIAARVGFRTNVGFFNPTANTVKATFKALRIDGVVIGTSPSITIEGYARVQKAVFDLIPTAAPDDFSWDDFWVTYTTDGPLFVYATVVDNRTGDGIYVTGANPR